MKKTLNVAVCSVMGAVVWACAGNPGPGDAGYSFNLQGAYVGEVVVEGEVFGTEMEVRTGPGGVLEGTYEVTSPINMAGEVTGSIVADSVHFSLQYLNPMDGCGGVLDGSGVVVEGGGSFSGLARVNDSCGGYLAGTFSRRRG